jgi:putative transcriptional regulator
MDDKNFNRLLESAGQAREIMNGNKKPSRSFIIEEPNVKEIRQKLNLTQTDFAVMLNISVNTLRNWEQNRRKPEGPARVLLGVAAAHPEVFIGQ